MDVIVPDWVDVPANVAAFSTLRRGGVSHAPYDDVAGSGGMNLGTHVGDNPDDVRLNRALLRTLLPAEPAWLNQVHGITVVDAATAAGSPDADASIATEPGVVCVIQTADCLPVLLCDSSGRVVGAAHAGWRGLVGGVLENTVARMRNAGADDIVAWLGPAIGPQTFEVGEDVVTAFTQRDMAMRSAFVAIPSRPGKYLADIYRLARMVLGKVGVSKVDGGGFCTVNDKDRFYSYRRDRVTGRMASLIWLK
ncbi:peptidoglycan editing factor PgeF [Noviherbaspirillum cavernae]|uniref:Purine nucleoside phosphorylase n=1 Tax=Noviherbaspirillum cavernae TaxID=2320862 RepID=A0A418X1G3_9BURK|nr:peptidoglycan editing factor PgeF [Noviherbaspirillum cavernae]RJG06278.1 peptidoglycan editing factor PgeF [Noviherbaspirillum cavernae]